MVYFFVKDVKNCYFYGNTVVVVSIVSYDGYLRKTVILFLI